MAEYTHIYFIGIGGVSMSALAELLLKDGYRVFGSDCQRGESLDRLESLGVKVYLPHAEGNVKKSAPGLVVYSLAIDGNNAEYKEAFDRISRQSGRQYSPYSSSPNMGGCASCDPCTTLCVADCCCEMMGGDLIRCC